MKLKHNADLTHEDARGWYNSYGWHITTANEGDVTIDAVEYDWLDGTDAEVIARLRETYDALTDDEAESIVAKAREVREAGETIEGLLDEAVEAYQSGDMDAVVEALDEAARVESEHGDSPATNDLRSQLLDDAAPTFDALVGCWNGACYATCERITLDADNLEDAIAEVQAMIFDDDEDYDIQVTIEDEDGNCVHTEHFENSVAKNQQEDMDETWEDEGEFSTNHLGVKDGQWYAWRSNGGSRGAFDRMDGSGRWIERYDEPTKIEPSEALEWLVKNAGMDTDEALDAMGDADSEHTKDDLVKDIGKCLWQEDQWVGVYRVRKNLYTVDGSDVNLVDDDEAVEFVADHDEDAVEEFKESL
jgi:hypothetical protein